MNQLGNLAIVCAKRPEVLMQLHGHQVVIHLRQETMQASWDDDEKISDMIRKLNFGRYAVKKEHSYD